jgi:chaperone modulatory protein CbpM
MNTGETGADPSARRVERIAVVATVATVVVVEVVQVVEEQLMLSLPELCRFAEAAPDLVHELVAHGVLDPAGDEPAQWHFGGTSLALTRRARRLMDDLGLNIAGAAVVIELLERIAALERRRGLR